MFQVNYSNGSDDQYTMGLSDWNQGYNGKGTNCARRVDGAHDELLQ